MPSPLSPVSLQVNTPTQANTSTPFEYSLPKKFRYLDHPGGLVRVTYGHTYEIKSPSGWLPMNTLEQIRSIEQDSYPSSFSESSPLPTSTPAQTPKPTSGLALRPMNALAVQSPLAKALVPFALKIFKMLPK